MALERWLVTSADALSRVPRGNGPSFATVLEHGSLSVEIYAPSGTDKQKPHTRDEAYVVLSGHGEFTRGSEQRSFGPGDVIFVPAGASHRFENFSDDFAVWVFFYGPEGGEAPKS